MKLPYKCPLCSKTFRTPQGRRGHLTFKHGQGKKSVYTEGIKKLIDAHKEGIELVKEKRRRIPKSALYPEKRRKITELTKDLEIDEEKWSEQSDSGMSGEESEYVPKKSFEGLKKALGHEPQNRLEGFEGLKKGLRRCR